MNQTTQNRDLSKDFELGKSVLKASLKTSSALFLAVCQHELP